MNYVYKNIHRKGENAMENIQGKHFSITDPQGVNTVIYRINKTEKEFFKRFT